MLITALLAYVLPLMFLAYGFLALFCIVGSIIEELLIYLWNRYYKR